MFTLYTEVVVTLAGEPPVSRLPDPHLENRILDAAQKLWQKGGEDALTMRAVARAADTNTPAVYRRFRDREDILRGLLRRVRLEIAALIAGALSPEEACERYVDYALQHPHEYQLLFQRMYDVDRSARSGRARSANVDHPARNAMRQKLEERFGSSQDSHDPLLTALWMLAHGAAALLISKAILPEETKAARRIFTAAVAALFKNEKLAKAR
jgi:AcrR family transcriptional regulator